MYTALRYRASLAGGFLMLLVSVAFCKTVPVSLLIEAEQFTAADTLPERADEYFWVLGFENKSWLRFSNIDFGTITTYSNVAISARTQTGTGLRGTFTIRLDSLNGTTIGAFDIERATTNDTLFHTLEAVAQNAAKLSGTHDVYVEFTTTLTRGNGCLLDWLRFSGTAASTGPKTYYVSAASGNDEWPGTLAQPFKTIAKASSVMVEGDVCTIRQGLYHEELAPRQGGNSGVPLTYQAYEGEKVVITGADPIGGWERYEGIYRTRLTKDLGPGNNQLFLGTQALPEARFPKFTTRFKKARENSPDDGDSDYQIYVVPPLSAPRDVVHPILFQLEFGDGGVCDGGSDGKCGWREMKLSHPSLNNLPVDALAGTIVWKAGNYYPETGRVTNSSFRDGNLVIRIEVARWRWAEREAQLIGHPLLISEEHEWAVKDGYLYYNPPAGTNPATLPLMMKTRLRVMNLSNRSDVVVKDLNFIGGAPLMLDSRNCRVSGCHFEHTNKYWLFYQNYSQGVVSEDFNQNRTEASGFFGFVMSGEHNVLEKSSVSWTAGNALKIQGRNNLVTDCSFHNVGYNGHVGASVVVQGQYNRLHQSTIHDTYRSGFTFGTGPERDMHNRVEYCNIYNTCLMNKDGASTYIYNKAGYTNEISHNWFSRCYVLYSGAHIYTDHCPPDLDLRIHHNVFFPNDYSSEAEEKFKAITLGAVMRVNNNTFLTQQNIARGSATWTEEFNKQLVQQEYLDKGRDYRNNILADVDRAGWMFSDTLKGDYRLTRGSPAIDSAEVISGVTDGYVGSKPDLGAYEYGGTAWVPGHTWGEVPSLSPIAYQGSLYNLAALQAPKVRIGMQSIQVQLQGGFNARVRVFNARGALVREVSASQSQRTVLLSTRAIASGWYLLQVVSGTHHINQPFMIAR